MDDIFNFGYNIHVKVSKPLRPPKDSLYASTAPILTSSSGFFISSYPQGFEMELWHL